MKNIIYKFNIKYIHIGIPKDIPRYINQMKILSSELALKSLEGNFPLRHLLFMCLTEIDLNLK